MDRATIDNSLKSFAKKEGRENIARKVSGIKRDFKSFKRRNTPFGTLMTDREIDESGRRILPKQRPRVC